MLIDSSYHQQTNKKRGVASLGVLGLDQASEAALKRPIDSGSIDFRPIPSCELTLPRTRYPIAVNGMAFVSVVSLTSIDLQLPDDVPTTIDHLKSPKLLVGRYSLQ